MMYYLPIGLLTWVILSVIRWEDIILADFWALVRGFVLTVWLWPIAILFNVWRWKNERNN